MTETTESITEPRVMAKVFKVPRTEKGTGLQSKINAWTNGKHIGEIHDVALELANGETKAVVIYEALPGEGAKADRVFAKVVEGAKLGESALQTKVNSFSKDKKIEVKKVATAVGSDSEALVVILHTKEGGVDTSDGDAS